MPWASAPADAAVRALEPQRPSVEARYPGAVDRRRRGRPAGRLRGLQRADHAPRRRSGRVGERRAVAACFGDPDGVGRVAGGQRRRRRLRSPPQPAPSPGCRRRSDSSALVLSAPSWLRVTVDGSVSMEGTFPAGTTKTFHGKSAMVRVGNAGGVEIYVNGKDVGKLGKSGDVVERAFTL